MTGSQSASLPHNHHHTIEGGISKDHLNESSNYLSDDPLMKSSQQIQNVASNTAKGKMYQYQSLQDESYFDASVYEQFISGPHNISQFGGVIPKNGGQGNNKVLVDDMTSYSHYI
jgi:hypothetical protein